MSFGTDIYKLYFMSDYFKGVVDEYVRKHRTSYMGAFGSMEIQKAYERHIDYLSHKERRD